MLVFQAYTHPDQIDLYPAGLSETPLLGGILGPTFSLGFCSLACRLIRDKTMKHSLDLNNDTVALDKGL